MIYLSYTPSNRKSDLRSRLLGCTVAEASIYISSPRDTVFLLYPVAQELKDSLLFFGKSLPNIAYLDRELASIYGVQQALLLDKNVLNFLKSLGSNNVLLSSVPSVKLLKFCKNSNIDYYYPSKMCKYFSTINNKMNQYKLFEKFSLPHPYVFFTGTASSISSFLQTSFIDLSNKIVIKEAISSGGHGIFVLDKNLLCINIDNRKSVILEKFYDVNWEYNVQYVIESGDVRFFSSSYQLIHKKDNRIMYLGNYYSSKSLSEIAPYKVKIERLLNHVSHNGFCGVIGIDAFKTKEGDFVFSEVNPRLNGSTYYVPFINKIKSKHIVRSFLTLPFKLTYSELYELLKKHSINLVENLKEGNQFGFFILDSSGFNICPDSVSFSYLLCGSSVNELQGMCLAFSALTQNETYWQEIISAIYNIENDR